MLQMAIEAVWLAVYWYFLEREGSIQKGAGRRILTLFLTMLIWFAGWGIRLVCEGYLQPPAHGRLAAGSVPTAWLLILLLFLAYDLFFDEEAFRYQWWKVLLPGVAVLVWSVAGRAAVPWISAAVFHGPLMYLFFLLLAGKRDYLTWKSALSMGSVYLALSAAVVLVQGLALKEPQAVLMILVVGLLVLAETMLLFLVENTLFAYQKGFEFRTERFQQEVLGQQYEEIKGIYLNMRGWRHDYHNHIQVLKAQLDSGNVEEAGRYLDELEQDLDQVDTIVKSGNMMVDAILNSKLTLAKQKEVALNCKAKVPKRLGIEDVDLCVILGNLLDNAVEACERIPKERRFLRIYLTVNGNQLYLSIQNSAREELNFNEQNYITSKRGNHGLGMKRVKAVVDKYEGYLRLANESGIFAAEATIPLH